MTAIHDQEYLDTLEAEHMRGRRRSPKPAAHEQRVDRQSPRWRRMRASLSEHHGLDESLDDYCDRVYKLIPPMIRVYCSVSRVNPVPVIDGRCVCCGRAVKVVT